MIRVFSLTALCCVIAYVGVLLILWRYQERIVFQPPAFPGDSAAAAVRARYRSLDGIDLHAYVVGSRGPEAPVVLVFHGNAEIARWLMPWAARLSTEARCCVVLAEYRGYDGTAGTPSYEGSARDARAALDYVCTMIGPDTRRIVYFGHSLGSAIAAELASDWPPRSLILQSPFSSALEMSKRMIIPGLTAFWGMVSRIHFDTLARVRSIACPVYVAHGDRDLIIPVRMGRAVFDTARVPGELLIVRGAGHNDVPDVGGDEYWSWLARAVRAEVR